MCPGSRDVGRQSSYGHTNSWRECDSPVLPHIPHQGLIETLRVSRVRSARISKIGSSQDRSRSSPRDDDRVGKAQPTTLKRRLPSSAQSCSRCGRSEREMAESLRGPPPRRDARPDHFYNACISGLAGVCPLLDDDTGDGITLFQDRSLHLPPMARRGGGRQEFVAIAARG